MNKRILKKKNTEGRVMYLFDRLGAIPKRTLALYFDMYPKDWSKVKNLSNINYTLNMFRAEHPNPATDEQSLQRVAQIRNGNFLRYRTLKLYKQSLNTVFEKRHVGVWISAELHNYQI